MKKFILLLTAAIFSTTLCMAQQKPERKQMSIEQRTEKMISALQLDDKQAKELKKLNEKYATYCSDRNARTEKVTSVVHADNVLRR